MQRNQKCFAHAQKSIRLFLGPGDCLPHSRRYQLFEEAFTIYKKSGMDGEAMEVLLTNIESLERATESAEISWSQLMSRGSKSAFYTPYKALFGTT